MDATPAKTGRSFRVEVLRRRRRSAANRASSRRSSRLHDTNVRRLKALLTLRDLKLYLLILVDIPKSRPADRAEMHENVRATVLLRNKAETLTPVQPFDGSCRHAPLP